MKPRINDFLSFVRLNSLVRGYVLQFYFFCHFDAGEITLVARFMRFLPLVEMTKLKIILDGLQPNIPQFESCSLLLLFLSCQLQSTY